VDWTCGAVACNTHRSPIDRCRDHRWICRATDCPSHPFERDQCDPTHLQWTCGSDDCRGEHLLSTDKCLHGTWRCGSLVCRGHRAPEVPNRCAHGAASVPSVYHFHIKIARHLVDILKNRTSRIDFTLFGRSYNRNDYRNIGEKIHVWDILILRREVDVQMFGVGLQTYQAGGALGNRLFVLRDAESRIRDYAYQASLVHECTHAIQDSRGLALENRESETAAYVAGALYAMYASPNGPEGELGFQAARPERDPASLVNRLAFFVAGDIHFRRSPGPDSLQRLQEAVLGIPMYGHNRQRDVFDGIPRRYPGGRT
jgi:hypothetical protein